MEDLSTRQRLYGRDPLAWNEMSDIRGAMDPAEREVNALLFGTKMGGAAGTRQVVSYSFSHPASVWAPGYDDAKSGVTELSAAAKDAVRRALAEWSRVAKIDFVEIQDLPTSVGVIRFTESDATSRAYAYLPTLHPASGDVWLPTGFSSLTAAQLEPGSVGMLIALHEIGHALGLTHPHASAQPLPPGRDWLGETVMSYRTFPGDSIDGTSRPVMFPQGLMELDIQAIRFLYGTRLVATGNDVYRFENAPHLFRTIVDEGGRDQIDWSNQSSHAKIDLRQGHWSQLGPDYAWTDLATGRFGSRPMSLRIADGSIIEDAAGGRGDDRIIGNGAGNRLLGDGGSDLLDGGYGDDRLLGLAGNDRLLGGSGNDELNGGIAFDILDGGDGRDMLFGGDAADRLMGGNGDDRLYGASGQDTLLGGFSADRLSGGAGDDIVRGGPGNDVLSGETGRDQFVIDRDPGTIDRILDFIPGIDRIVLPDGTAIGDVVASATLTGNGTLLHLGRGQDLMVLGAIGVQADWFTG